MKGGHTSLSDKHGAIHQTQPDLEIIEASNTNFGVFRR